MGPHLQGAILAAEGVPGVPPEALHVAWKRLALLQAVSIDTEDGAGLAAASAAAYLQQQISAMVMELQGKMDMVSSTALVATRSHSLPRAL